MRTAKATATRARSSGRKPIAAARRATALLVAGGTAASGVEPVAIPVRPSTLKVVASEPVRMRALIETYGAAVEKSRRSGRAVRFVVDVAPQGALRITPIEGEAAQRPEPLTVAEG